MIERGDVIQIAPGAKCVAGLHGLFALVDEVRGWGVIAFVAAHDGRAYVRLKTGDFERIGPAPFLPGDMIIDDEVRSAAAGPVADDAARSWDDDGR